MSPGLLEKLKSPNAPSELVIESVQIYLWLSNERVAALLVAKNKKNTVS